MDINKLINPAWIEHDGRRLVLDPHTVSQDMREAADEIERLRAVLVAVQDWARHPVRSAVDISSFPLDDVDAALLSDVHQRINKTGERR